MSGQGVRVSAKLSGRVGWRAPGWTFAWLGMCQRVWAALGVLVASVGLAMAQNPADVMGPDGILYPDWSRCGVPGGIPADLQVRVTLTAADLSEDAAAALESAAEAAYAAGGGVVRIPTGTFNLNRPVLIRRDNVVLRGNGWANTKFMFQYQPPANGINFYVAGGVTAGPTTLHNNTWIEAHADPVDLQRLTLKVDGNVLKEKRRIDGDWDATFSLDTTGRSIRSASGTGNHTLRAEAEYSGGVVCEKNITVNLINATDANAMPAPDQLGAISFCGLGAAGSKPVLTADGPRGQSVITLASGHGVVQGDRIELVAPTTPRWNEETGNTSDRNGRRYQYLVEAVNGNVVTLNQPLRIDYPIVDGSYVREITPIRGCGVENLTVEQTHDLWTSGIVFSWPWECWAKGVRVNKAGRFPLYFTSAKWCEVRDTILDDAWFKGGGGSAYAGFFGANDCLMDGVTTYKLRHAPHYEGAAGNVIRNSFFYDSDMQWHAAWCHENLFENCVVEANRGNGAYGFGAWSSPPEDTAHGPNGPRNVVYNCDITSPLAGAWIGGVGENWIFAHNRIAADSGYGAYVQKSGGHIFDDNAFVLKSAGAGIWLNDTNCTGVEVTGNAFRGLAGQNSIACGATAPTLNADNTTFDLLTLASFLNPGFESAWTTGWTRDAADNNMSSLLSAAARTGYNGLRVTDANATLGSSVTSSAFNVTPGKTYAVRYWTRTLAGANGIGMYLKFFNSGGTEIRSTSGVVPTSTPWQQAVYQATAPSNALTAKIRIHSYVAGIQTADFDDFGFGEVAHAIANNSFEDGLAFWTTSGNNGMSVVVTNAAKSGSYGLRVTDTSGTLGSEVVSANFPAQPGWTYQLRYWGRQISGNGMGTSLQFYNASNGYITNVLKQLPAVADWREYTLRATAPSDAATVRARLRSYTASIVTADFDSLVLSEIPPRPQPAVPSMSEWQRNPVFPAANPGFESDFASWDLTGDGGMSQVVNNPAGAHGGSKYMRVTDGSDNSGSSALSAPFLVQPGKTYRMSAWAKNVSGTAGAELYIKFYDATGSEVPNSHGNYMVPTSATNWTPVSVSKIAPVDAVFSGAYVHTDNAQTVTAEFDDFEFKRE